MNYIDLYKQNVEFQKKDKHLYKDALNKYYGTNFCKESDDIIRERGEYKIGVKCVKKKTFLTIDLPRYKNIFTLLNEYNIKKKELLVDLNQLIIGDTINKVSKLDNIKKKYKEYDENIININKLINYQKNIISIIEKEKENSLFKVNESFYKKKNLYDNIQNKIISPSIRKQLIKFYSSSIKKSKGNNINISSKDIPNLSKELQISKDDLGNWLKWINESRNYINHSINNDRVRDKYIKESELQTQINKNFLEQIPNIPTYSKNIILSDKYMLDESSSNIASDSPESINDDEEDNVEDDKEEAEEEEEEKDDKEDEEDDKEDEDTDEEDDKEDEDTDEEDDKEDEEDDKEEEEDDKEDEKEAEEEEEEDDKEEDDKEEDDNKENNKKGGSSPIIQNIDALIKDIRPLKSPINKSNLNKSNLNKSNSDIKIVHIKKKYLPVDMHADLLTNKHQNIRLRKI